MHQVLRYAHITGLSLFLGSIFTFVLISARIDNAGLENIAFGRQVISYGTMMLTLPGLWLLAVSGVWLGLMKYGAGHTFFRLKLLLIGVLVINAHFFIMPAVYRATDLAAQSLAVGALVPAYTDAYLTESIFGAVNVLLAVAVASFRVWRPGMAVEA